MQLSQSSPDALVSFSDFLLERFGLVATMQVAVIASIAFHVIVIVGMGFKLPSILREAAPHNVMDVVLVNSKSAARPVKADALAQANLDGGGNTDQKLRASSPFPAADPRDPTPELKAARARVKQLELEARELMTTIKSKAAVSPLDQPAPGAVKAESNEARDIIERSLEIERLEAQIRRDHQKYQERPRRTFIGARAQEYRFATYIDTWRQRIERIGNLNYPQEARTRRIYASLRLTVAIKANGEVEDIEINKSSGYPFLDQAAKRIVRLAAPFDPFPAGIKSDTDILHITRTWTFTRADQVTTE